MASRILARRLSSLARVIAEPSNRCRGFATAAQRIQDAGNGDVKQRATSSAFAIPFADLFPPLGRGAPLVNLLDIVDDAFGHGSKVPSQTYRSHSRTPWDVMEDEKAFKLRVDLPGLSKEEVKVDVEDGHLVIKGQKKEDTDDDWSSRSTCSYSIKIKLPENVKVEAIKAELKHGVLRLIAPKVEESKKRVVVSVE